MKTLYTSHETVKKNTLKDFIEIHDTEGKAMMVKANRIAVFWNKLVGFEDGKTLDCIESYEELKEKMSIALAK